MRITICDDEPFYMEAINASIGRWSMKHGVPVHVRMCQSSEDLLSEIEKQIPDDVYFLDIQFPGEVTGLFLAQEIRKRNEHSIIVFTTNYEDYAIEGYKVNALRYLQKPIMDVQIYECLDIAYHQWALLHDTYLVFESGRMAHRIAYKSVYYVESKAHYIEIHTIGNNNVIEIRCKLNDFMEKLPDEMFKRCHRSYVVNQMYVQSIGRNEVVLTGQERLPISTKYREDLLNGFRSLFSR